MHLQNLYLGRIYHEYIFVIPDLYGIIHVMKIHILKVCFCVISEKDGLV